MSGDIERYYEELNFFLLDFHLPEDRTLLLHLPELVVISLKIVHPLSHRSISLQLWISCAFRLHIGSWFLVYLMKEGLINLSLIEKCYLMMRG